MTRWTRRAASAALLAVLLVGGLATASRANESAGEIDRIQGSAVATLGSFSRPLRLGSEVFVGDRLVTADASRLRIRFLDGAVMSLGDNSSMIIESYEIEGDEPKALLDVVHGVFLAASGAIARIRTDAFRVSTPSAVLGVRGTEVWGRQSGAELEVAFLSGTAIIVSNPAGAVAMTEPGSGLKVVTGERPPEAKPWSKARLDEAGRMVAFD